MRSTQKKVTINKDILLTLVLLLIALAFWGARRFARQAASQAPHGTGPYAQVMYGGDIIREVYLSEDQVFSVPEAPQVEIEVKDNQIYFLHSNCPDQICVHTGALEQDGEFAACLPNNIMLWIVEEDEPQS